MTGPFVYVRNVELKVSDDSADTTSHASDGVGNEDSDGDAAGGAE